MNRMKRIVLATLTLGLFCACSLPQPAIEAHPSSTAAIQSPPALSSTADPQTDTAPVDCPIPHDSGVSLSLATSTSLVQDVLAFLNAGGGIPNARIALRNWNNTSPEDTSLSLFDIDGDSDLDVAVSQRQTTEMPIESRVFILSCEETQYQLSYLSPNLSGSRPPDLYAVLDITGDGLEDILILQESCGAHTCFVQPILLTWTGSQIADRWVEPTDDIPSPMIELILGEAEFPVIAITGTSIQSAGAGPLRPFRRDYRWEESSEHMALLSETNLPATYRIHVLLDAEQAYLQGDFDFALQEYGRVIEDDSLDNWINGADAYNQLSAYALFRSAVLHLERGESALAEAAYLVLREGYTTGTGLPFAEMASAFWTEFVRSGNVDAGCNAAKAYAELHAPEILDALSYGYANPAYTVCDICPQLP